MLATSVARWFSLVLVAVASACSSTVVSTAEPPGARRRREEEELIFADGSNGLAHSLAHKAPPGPPEAVMTRLHPLPQRTTRRLRTTCSGPSDASDAYGPMCSGGAFSWDLDALGSREYRRLPSHTPAAIEQLSHDPFTSS